ncbi:MAG TPA: hypothetical protein VHD57_13035 [Vicinamibacterales bacterium]|jgi:hypothetical protein|nr:hypothetical protein [Vicinamibacterales bacterium]
MLSVAPNVKPRCSLCCLKASTAATRRTSDDESPDGRNARRD